MNCRDCGKLICDYRGVSGVTGCRDGASYGILKRAIRDEPQNERRIRGMC